MNVAHGRAEGDHVEVGILLEEESAFQSRVDGQHQRILAENLAIRILSYLQDLRVWVRRPARIAVAMLHLGASQTEDGSHWISSGIRQRVYRAALAGLNDHLACFRHLHRRQVGRRLHQSFHLVAHAQHTVRTGNQRLDQSRSNVFRQTRFRCVDSLHGQADVRVDALQFLLHVSLEVVQQHAHRFAIVLLQTDDSRSLAWDGVVQVTTFDSRQRVVILLAQ